MFALISMVVLTAATFAWFTQNRVVGTSRAEGRSGTANVRLLISATPSDFTSSESYINQVNSANAQFLMPVSTADLRSFVRNATNGDEAHYFAPVDNEQNYYHGRV